MPTFFPFGYRRVADSGDAEPEGRASLDVEAGIVDVDHARQTGPEIRSSASFSLGVGSASGSESRGSAGRLGVSSRSTSHPSLLPPLISSSSSSSSFAAADIGVTAPFVAEGPVGVEVATAASANSSASSSSEPPSRSPSPSGTGLPPRILIENPDGSIMMAVDPIKEAQDEIERERRRQQEAEFEEQERRHRQRRQLEMQLDEETAAAFLTALTGGVFSAAMTRQTHLPERVDFDDMFPSFELMLHWRRKRSLLFLLSVDCSYVILTLMIAIGISLPLSMIFLRIVNLLINAVGIRAVVRDDDLQTNVFISFFLFILVVYAFTDFSPIFLVRVVILLLTIQYRMGLTGLKNLQTEERIQLVLRQQQVQQQLPQQQQQQQQHPQQQQPEGGDLNSDSDEDEERELVPAAAAGEDNPPVQQSQPTVSSSSPAPLTPSSTAVPVRILP